MIERNRLTKFAVSALLLSGVLFVGFAIAPSAYAPHLADDMHADYMHGLTFKFKATLSPPSPTQHSLVVNGTLNSDSESGTFSGMLTIAPNGHPPSPCFSGSVSGGSLQPPSPTGSPTDVFLMIGGTLAAPLPTGCPSPGGFTLDIHFLNGLTILTVDESSGPLQWTGTNMLTMTYVTF